MSNVRRLLITDRIFFVTVNLRREIPSFASDEFPLLLQAIGASRKRIGFLLCGYVLMPDHWHALIHASHPTTIARALQDIKWLSARIINRHRGCMGSIWQRQFWDRFVRHEKELRERLDYMHFNPVRRRLVAQPGEWRWSSYNSFALEKSVNAGCPLQIDYVRLPDQTHR